MLEECVDLLACEMILSEVVRNVFLLGEIQLSDRDIEILAKFVQQKISPSISKGTAYLKTKTPTCFVCFLVGMGRYYDKQAGYWLIIEKKVGSIDINWRTKWGRFFLQFLKQNLLPEFDEEEGLAYVTPILAHVCIPDCCLDEYFALVVVPLVNQDLHNPLDREEISSDLKLRRKFNTSRLEIENAGKKVFERIKALEQEKRVEQKKLQIYEEVAEFKAEEEECDRRRIAVLGYENIEPTRLTLIRQIEEETNHIDELQKEIKRLQERMDGFTNRYQPILNIKPQIEDLTSDNLQLNNELLNVNIHRDNLLEELNDSWGRLSTEPWNEKMGLELHSLPLESLRSQIERYHYLEKRRKIIYENINILLTSQKEKKRSPSLIWFVATLVKIILKRVRWKTPVSQPNGLQKLYSFYDENEKELQNQLESINELFIRLPINSRLLEKPSIELYEVLNSIKLKHEEYLVILEKLTILGDKKLLLRERINYLFSSLGISMSRNLNGRINKLNEMLEEAERFQIITLEAKRLLDIQIRPECEASQRACNRLQSDLDILDQQLEELGDGSIQKGLDLVQEFHRLQEKVEKDKQEIDSRYSDIDLLKIGLNDKGMEKLRKELDESITEIERQIQFNKSELRRIEHETGSYPAQYVAVDEPIRRFLLYGGITAERFLIASVILFARVRSGESVVNISDLNLPDRYLQNFFRWWENYQTTSELKSILEEETNLVTGERYRTPQIYFDPAMGEVKANFPSQRFLRPERGSRVRLDVISAETANSIYSAPINLYNRSNGLVETHSYDNIILTAPSDKYVLRLLSDETLIHAWEIQGPSVQAPFLAFSTKSHKLIKGEQLPKSPLIMIVSKRLKMNPQDCILSDGGVLFEGWREYTWYEVDLSTVEELRMVSPTGQELTISLSSDLDSDIKFIGGNRLAGVLSDDRSVFDSAPKFIHIPVKDRDALHLLRFSLFFEDESQARNSKHYQVDEIVNQLNLSHDDCIDIPLDAEQLLGTNPIGSFTLRIHRPPYFNWQSSFCIFPQLSASFDQVIYTPSRIKTTDVIVTLTHPEKSTFKPDTPATTISSERTSSIIKTLVSEDEITGMLLYSSVDGRRNSMPLTIFIPKLQWRLQGLNDPQYDQWFDVVQEELWIGDWIDAQALFLIVKTPWFCSGEASLVLQENSISFDIGKIQNQIIRTDLKALEDTLRAGPSLEVVSINLKDIQTKIPDIPLFTVRTRWQVDNIRCLPYPEDVTRRLDVSWNDKGHTEQIIVRLWHWSNRQFILLKEQVVSQDKHEVVFRLKNVEFPSGTYLIHLECYDLWSQRPVFPPDKAPNSQLIEIYWEIPKDIVTLQSVSVEVHINDKRIYLLPQDAYKIRIIGKVKNWRLPEDLKIENFDHILVTLYNEDWFVGNLEVDGVPGVITHLTDTNPVKFDYDTQRRIVTCIEDRHGDGATYCWDCNKLFWYQETVLDEKIKHGKHNYPPIEFRVIWKSE